MSNEPEWLRVGAAVASVSDNRNRPSVERTTVERLTKRDVVLSNGERFPRAGMLRREGGAWGWTVVLLPADAPAVTEAEAKIRSSDQINRARFACDEFMRGRLNAFDVILALGPLTGVADAVAALDSGRSS